MTLCTACRNILVDQLLSIVAGNVEEKDVEAFVDSLELEAKRTETTPELQLMLLMEEANEIFYDAVLDLADAFQMRRENG